MIDSFPVWKVQQHWISHELQVGVLLVQVVRRFKYMLRLETELLNFVDAVGILHKLLTFDEQHGKTDVVEVLAHTQLGSKQAIPNEQGVIDIELLQHVDHEPAHRK
jgi:hypothetical protein